MSEDAPASHRLFVKGLESFGVVTVDGREFHGVELAYLVAINPELLETEICRTPQLVFELGRATAAASRAQLVTEARYRQWRDTKILEVTTDPEKAAEEGLTDGVKPATQTAAASWVRTLTEYTAWHETQAHAKEAYNVLYAAWEAAKLRKDAAYAFRRDGVDAEAAPLAKTTDRYTGVPGAVYDTQPGSVDYTPASAPPQPTGPPGPPPATPARPAASVLPPPPPGPPGPPPTFNS